MGTLHYNVVILRCCNVAGMSFYNVVKVSFLQRCTMLYLQCVFAGKLLSSATNYNFLKISSLERRVRSLITSLHICDPAPPNEA